MIIISNQIAFLVLEELKKKRLAALILYICVKIGLNKSVMLLSDTFKLTMSMSLGTSQRDEMMRLCL